MFRQFITCKKRLPSKIFFTNICFTVFTSWIFISFLVLERKATELCCKHKRLMTDCYSIYPKVPFCVLFVIKVKGDITVYKHCLCYSNYGWPLISLGDVKVTISPFVNSKLRWKQFLAVIKPLIWKLNPCFVFVALRARVCSYSNFYPEFVL